MKYALLLCALVTLPTQAAFFNGNNLLEDIQQASTESIAFSNGYVAGVADSVSSITCLPPAVKVNQLRQVVGNFLASNPAIRHQSAEVMVYKAINQAWPCPKNSK